jgi:hypothetical protein
MEVAVLSTAPLLVAAAWGFMRASTQRLGLAWITVDSRYSPEACKRPGKQGGRGGAMGSGREAAEYDKRQH